MTFGLSNLHALSIAEYALIAAALCVYPLTWKMLGIPPEPKRPFYERWDMFGAKLQASLQALDARWRSRWVLPALPLVAVLGAHRWLAWPAIDSTGSVRMLVLLAAAMLTWKSVTMDIDLASGRAFAVERGLMIAALAGLWFSPGFVFPLLFIAINYLRAWQHHQHILLRPLFFFASLLPAQLVAALVLPRPPALTLPFYFLLITVAASHYFVSGVGKLRLGRRWYAWVWRNRLGNLFVGAYIWGWCRFRSAESVVRFARLLRYVERPAQLFALSFELAALVVLVHPRVAEVVFACAIVFHLLTLALSGIFFWQNMVLLTALIVSVHRLPPALSASLFGVVNCLVALVIIVALPLRKKLWKPFQLAWWDGPLVSRVDWIVVGASGTRYGLYNDFMNPNDRLFGNKIGAEHGQSPRVSWHCGQCETEETALALYARAESIDAIKRRLGHVVHHPGYVAEHRRYLTAFFTNFNRGARKRVCPVWLRAPGDQLFYWGPLPRFTGQEKVTSVLLSEREQLFDGNAIVTLREQVIDVVVILDVVQSRR